MYGNGVTSRGSQSRKEKIRILAKQNRHERENVIPEDESRATRQLFARAKET